MRVNLFITFCLFRRLNEENNVHVVVRALEQHLPLEIEDALLLRRLERAHQRLVILPKKSC